GSMPYTDRLDYFCSMTNNWAYALSVEKLAGIEVPERAEYLRVILAELTRLQNHASLLGFLLSDMGAWGTPLMYAFREREKILDTARGARRHVRSPNDAGVGDARERGDPEASVRANCTRPNCESKSKGARISSAGWRSVRSNRRTKG